MNCRVDECDRVEWMGRQICAPHLKMLPADLYHAIRKAVNGKTKSDELPALIDRALAIITELEVQQHVTAQIAVFRTHMATVHAIVAGIRTVPMTDVLNQLAASNAALLATDPDLHAERGQHIARDLAFLHFFADARDRLGEIIEAYPVPTPATAELVADNGQADGAGDGAAE